MERYLEMKEKIAEAVKVNLQDAIVMSIIGSGAILLAAQFFS